MEKESTNDLLVKLRALPYLGKQGADVQLLVLPLFAPSPWCLGGQKRCRRRRGRGLGDYPLRARVYTSVDSWWPWPGFWAHTPSSSPPLGVRNSVLEDSCRAGIPVPEIW